MERRQDTLQVTVVYSSVTGLFVNFEILVGQVLDNCNGSLGLKLRAHAAIQEWSPFSSTSKYQILYEVVGARQQIKRFL